MKFCGQKLKISVHVSSMPWWVRSPGGWGVLPYIRYIGMCGPKECGFSAVLVINRVSILADFGHFGHKLCMVFVL